MIPFLDMQAQYREIGAELEEAVLATLRSGQYILGEPVNCFEAEFADFCGARHAIAVSSGTAALHLALLAEGIGPGDEVITVPTTFVATVAAILYTGATPVLVDIDPVTWTMDPDRLAEAITERTAAIMPVHFHGRLADMDRICAIARDAGVPVIEDAAQSHGAERGGKRAGTFGAMGCFSFYPGKNLGAAGEGGAIVTDDDALADRLRALRDWGKSDRHTHALQGYNYRMDAIQGAVLGVKLPRLAAWTDGRRRVANAYHAGLADGIDRASGPFGADHVCHVYAIRSPGRDALATALEAAGVPTNLHYARPVHRQPAYCELGYGKGDLPVAEAYAEETLSLPIYPELTPAQVERITTLVNLLAAEPKATHHLQAEAVS